MERHHNRFPEGERRKKRVHLATFFTRTPGSYHPACLPSALYTLTIQLRRESLSATGWFEHDSDQAR